MFRVQASASRTIARFWFVCEMYGVMPSGKIFVEADCMPVQVACIHSDSLRHVVGGRTVSGRLQLVGWTPRLADCSGGLHSALRAVDRLEILDIARMLRTNVVIDVKAGAAEIG